MSLIATELEKATLNVLSIKGMYEELSLFISDHNYNTNLLNCVVRRPTYLQGKEAEEWSKKNWGATKVTECSIKSVDNGLIITFVTDKPPFKWLAKLRCCYPNLEFNLSIG